MIESERDKNMDFIYGEGYSAKRRADQAARAAAARAAEEEYTRWAAAHPEEARAEEEKRRKERAALEKKWARRGRGARGGSSGKQTDHAAYWAGMDAGKTVGLDPQAEDRRQKRIGRAA